MHGHVETPAKAVAEGARGVDGTQVSIKRVPVDERFSRGKGRWRFYLDCDAAWRARNNAHQLSHHPSSLGHGDSRRSLRGAGPDENGRDYRRHALWRFHYGGRGWIAPAQRKRIGHRALSGPAHNRDCKEASGKVVVPALHAGCPRGVPASITL